MKTFWVSLLGLIVVTSCASVGAVIEGGKQFTTGVVDGAVKGSATVVSAVADDVVSVGEFAVNTTAGIVETVAEEIDKQTDELQSKPE